jgi:hypothetical protein
MRIYVIEQRPKGSQEEFRLSPSHSTFYRKEENAIRAVAFKNNGARFYEYRLMPYERMEVQP